MKNSKSPHRPPEISPESFSFPQKNPQGNIISRQIRRKFRVSEPTNHMHGNAITPHMTRKQYNPTGQVTFFRTIHEKNTGNISATHFQNTKNTPWTIHPGQYATNNTPRTIKQRAIYTQEAPAPHGTGASPMLLCRLLCQRIMLYASEIRSWYSFDHKSSTASGRSSTRSGSSASTAPSS